MVWAMLGILSTTPQGFPSKQYSCDQQGGKLGTGGPLSSQAGSSHPGLPRQRLHNSDGHQGLAWIPIFTIHSLSAEYTQEKLGPCMGRFGGVTKVCRKSGCADPRKAGFSGLGHAQPGSP
jgi:hypothetical protein